MQKETELKTGPGSPTCRVLDGSGPLEAGEDEQQTREQN